jgi:hypothetical protein
LSCKKKQPTKQVCGLSFELIELGSYYASATTKTTRAKEDRRRFTGRKKEAKTKASPENKIQSSSGQRS